VPLIALRACSDGNGPAQLPQSAHWHALVEAEDPVAALERVFARLGMALQLPLDFPATGIPAGEWRLRELLAAVDGLCPDAEASGDSRCALMSAALDACLERFALAAHRGGGECVTAEHTAALLVALADPGGGTIYDPCFGSGRLLARAAAHASMDSEAVQLMGAESNAWAWRAGALNLALRGYRADLGSGPASAFESTQGAVQAQFILADPPFNAPHCGQEFVPQSGWLFGAPPAGNANFAWLQHAAASLAPGGRACLTMGNSSLTAQTCGEGDLRRCLVEADYVDCIVALPPHFSPLTRTPACIWVMTRGKMASPQAGLRSRCGETLFIDAQRALRGARAVTSASIEALSARIAETYRSWRGAPGASPYEDIPGFCRAVTHDDIAAEGGQLTPGRYCGSASDAPEPADATARVRSLIGKLRVQFEEARRLDLAIQERLQVFTNDE
jgi:type I restriction enzyme M protein